MVMKLIKLIVFLLVCICIINPTASSNDKKRELALITRVYVTGEDFYDVPQKAIEEQNRIKSFLLEQLSTSVFEIVDDKNIADAILKFSYGEIIVLDGLQPDPPKYFYKYDLINQDKKVVWTMEFTISSRLVKSEIDHKASIKITNKLIKDWIEAKNK